MANAIWAGELTVGEAKRRRAEAATMSAGIRADIASAVRSVPAGFSGCCWFRQMLGQHALAMLGIRAEIILGSLVYRAGPDPLWDSLTYTTANDNCGWFKNEGTFEPITEAGPHGRFAGHAWLEYDDQLVDFTVGDWRAHFDELRKGLPGEYRPIKWTAPPLPEFFWSNADALKRPWKPTGAPPLSEAWYGPLRVPRGTEDAVRAQIAITKNAVLDTVRPAVPLLKRNLGALGLPERIGDISTLRLRPAGTAVTPAE